MKKNIVLLIVILFSNAYGFSQKSIYEVAKTENLSFSTDDFGSMFTFDEVPTALYEKVYQFKADAQWLEHAQKSAVQFGGGCSGAFVSADGLILTNHHCVRGSLPAITQAGEDIQKNGFYAPKPELERRLPNTYVDVLMEIEDVSAYILNAMGQETSDSAKFRSRNQEMNKLAKEKEQKTGLVCNVVMLYNGGKYSLYSYKRYKEIRLVMIPDGQIASTGWDMDNFTYPRYELDFAFARAYDENGKPAKIAHFYKWSAKEAKPGEAIFVVGRPGKTERMLSVAELEFMRDYQNPFYLYRFNEVFRAQYTHFENNPGRESELLAKLMSIGNGRKYFAGLVMALNDEYLMAKKRAFEKELMERVNQNKELKAQYGNLWQKIDSVTEIRKTFSKELNIYNLSQYNAPNIWKTAFQIVEYAQEMALPENQRSKMYTGKMLETTKARILTQTDDATFEKLLIESLASYFEKAGWANCRISKKLFNNLHADAAYQYFIGITELDNQLFLQGLIDKPEMIHKSTDILLQVVINIKERQETFKELQTSTFYAQALLNQELGRLIYTLYEGKIPPDATSTIRISHGHIAGYEYNGTFAQPKSTFYGLYDRYTAFGGANYPWGLHEIWKNPPTGLNLAAPMCFASTNDIVGGNSGSSVINTNGEVIGLVHDGNLESLAGSYIYMPENNRAVASDVIGIMESLKYVYKTDALITELTNAKR